jgi:hypothetical protein
MTDDLIPQGKQQDLFEFMQFPGKDGSDIHKPDEQEELKNLLKMMNEPTAKELGEQGMTRAVDHAERESPGWKDKCFDLFKEWLSKVPVGHRFLMEDFNEWALENGLETPPSFNAFGHLPKRAAAKKLIHSTGVAVGKKKRGHGSWVCIWEKL